MDQLRHLSPSVGSHVQNNRNVANISWLFWNNCSPPPNQTQSYNSVVDIYLEWICWFQPSLDPWDSPAPVDLVSHCRWLKSGKNHLRDVWNPAKTWGKTPIYHLVSRISSINSTLVLWGIPFIKHTGCLHHRRLVEIIQVTQNQLAGVSKSYTQMNTVCFSLKMVH